MKIKKILAIGLPVAFLSSTILGTGIGLISCSSNQPETKSLNLSSLTANNLVNGKLIISSNIEHLVGQIPANLQDKITSVEFDKDSKITIIPKQAFCYCTKLTSVNFPKTLKEIGMFAFTNTALSDVDLSNCSQLENIGTMSFIYNVSWPKHPANATIKSVKLPNNLKNINAGAFAYQNEISSINIPSGVISISYQPKGEQKTILGAFQNCTGLTNVSFDQTGTASLAIGQYTFNGCTGLSSKTITLPPRLAEISGNAFQAIANLTLNINNTTTNNLNLIPCCFTGASKMVINVKNEQIKSLVEKALAPADKTQVTINVVK